MFGKIKEHIADMQKQLEENKGIIPDSWKPWAEFIFDVLTILRPFFNTAEKVIIDEICAAIKLLEG